VHRARRHPLTDRRAAAISGHTGDEATARRLLADPSAAVRATALGALSRMGAVGEADVTGALDDADPAMRRRACQVAAARPGLASVALLACLDDPDPTVVEVAAWALGEQGEGDDSGAHVEGQVAGRGEVVDRLSAVATTHDDPLCREAAVAALGALGDERGLAAILAGTRDRATVRRRAVIALAPFAGPEVDAALLLAKDDKDWQVRQAAEDLS